MVTVMRISSFMILFFMSISFSLASYAQPSILFSDISAGVFRFQFKLAEQGNPEAQYKVGEMYEVGKGVKKDLPTAMKWFEKAAAQNHKKAGHKLLFLDIKNNGLNNKSKTELGVLRQEAASGNPDAQYFLGKMYAAGIGVPKSLNNALTWLNKATFNGVPEAEHEAIAVEEKIARIREKEAHKKAVALEKSKKKKAEEEKAKKLKKKEAEKKRLAAEAKKKSKRDAEARKAASERQKLNAQRAELAREKARLQREREEARKAMEESEAAQAANGNGAKKKASFEADPCKGKKARFLSTCR